MGSLEAILKTNLFGRLKYNFRKIGNSMIGKVAVYSLAGILGAGLGYGCGGDNPPGQKNETLKIYKTDVYQVDSKIFPDAYPVNALDAFDTEKENYQDSTLIKDVFGIETKAYSDTTTETEVYLDINNEIEVYTDISKETNVYQDLPTKFCIDNDKDGYGINCALGFDCDDNNPAVHKLLKCNYNGNSCTQGQWYELFCVEKCQTPPEETCDSKDNDCDGKTDENLEKIVSCGYNNQGIQKQVCINGNYANSGSCNDSDVCKNGEKQEKECGNTDIGECQIGTQYKTCVNGEWGSWNNCNGSINATNEICDNKDNNCDGQTDENLTQPCSTVCGTGLETCVSESWKNCSAPQPSIEVCDGKDNNCDGKVDEGCEILCWDKTFGGSDDDEAFSIQQTFDGGYIAAGWTKPINTSLSDALVFKLDSNGNLEWDKTIGGSGADAVKSILQTDDGKYIAAGWTYSKGAGENDAWVLKLDTNGEIEWEKTFGEKNYDGVNQIFPTKDGGYIAAGSTYPKGVGNNNALVLKLDQDGNKEWDKNFGGINSDSAYSTQQTTDLGYIVAGSTSSKGAGNYDGWVFKLDLNGELEWDKTFGGSDSDWVKSIHQTTDGGYIAAGEKNISSSDTDMGDAYVYGDAWVFKLDSNGNLEWDKAFGKYGWENIAYSVRQTNDGGYIAVGKTPQKDLGNNWDNYDLSILYYAWVFKFDSSGNLEWDKNFGESYFADEAYSIQQTTDLGYIVAGSTTSKGAGGSDAWVFKLDKNGDLCK
ncbi:hypothetical protein HY636_03885 [Candidatus Woesearchaeota archaeon]|nr:hypothetical protein [Candidatus Woesearchaeota archaeon]